VKGTKVKGGKARRSSKLKEVESSKLKEVESSKLKVRRSRKKLPGEIP